MCTNRRSVRAIETRHVSYSPNPSMSTNIKRARIGNFPNTPINSWRVMPISNLSNTTIKNALNRTSTAII